MYVDLISCNTVTLLQILTDWKLIIIVLVIVLVAVFLLLLGEAIPFLRRTVALMDDPEHGDGRNVRSRTLDLKDHNLLTREGAWE